MEPEQCMETKRKTGLSVGPSHCPALCRLTLAGLFVVTFCHYRDGGVCDNLGQMKNGVCLLWILAHAEHVDIASEML